MMESKSKEREVDKGIALVLEILPAIFGVFGIGWIYSGRTNTGFILLISGLLLIWGGYAAIFIGSTALAALTLGVGALGYCLICFVPFVQFLAAVGSAIALNNELSEG